MKPFSLLIKPAGPDCNLDCKYCFYSCKSEMFDQTQHRMTDEILEKITSDYLGINLPSHSIAWQGGEPSLMGLDFYRKAVDLQKKYSQTRIVSNAFQTNGTLIDNQWASFFAQNKFLLGISLDGPKEIHDHYRLNLNGQGSYDQVMSGIKACKDNNVEFNILTLLNNRNVTHPDELWDFFNGHGLNFLQFIPCLETDSNGKVQPFSLKQGQYADFMCRLLDLWLGKSVTTVSVRLFDSICNYLVHGCHTNCTFGKSCNDYIVIEHNGDAYCCDFFVDQKYKIGNIKDNTIAELFNSSVKSEFTKLKGNYDNKCFVCRFSEVCRGGCLKDRISQKDFKTASYFCQDYKKIFEYIMPRLQSLPQLYKR